MRDRIVRKPRSLLVKLFFSVLSTAFQIALIAGIYLWATTVKADEEDALSYFQQGEKAYAREQWSRAKSLYEAAVSEHAQDGDLIVNPTVTQTLRPGPGFRVTTDVQGESVHYFPNRRLAEIQTHELDVKARAQLAFKELNPPELKVSYALIQADGDNRLMAGESVRLTVDVFNQGESAADGVELTVNIAALDFTQTTRWREIDSEGQRSAEWVLNLPKQFKEDEMTLDIRVQEKDGYSPDIVLANVPVMPWQLPQLQVAMLSRPEVLAGRRSVQSFEIRNLGGLPAQDVRIKFATSNELLELKGYVTPQSIGLLEPGAATRIDLEVLPSIKLQGGTDMPLTLSLWSGDTAVTQENLNLIASHQAVQGNTLVAGVAAPFTVAQLGDIAVPSGFPEGKVHPRDYAVVIGNRDYATLAYAMHVPYALNDRKEMTSLVQRTLGVPAENILQGTENMTAANLQLMFGRDGSEGTLAGLIKAAGGADTVYVYYSGHGMPDPARPGQAYLLPVDVSPNDAARVGYSLETLYAQLAVLPAKRIVVMLDACFTGRSDTLMANEKAQSLVPGTSAMLLASRLPVARDDRMLVFAASGSGELAHWLPANRHGLFTSFLLKGLSGEADNGDKRLTAGELQAYLASRVTSTALRYVPAREQHPELTGNGQTLLTTYR